MARNGLLVKKLFQGTSLNRGSCPLPPAWLLPLPPAAAAAAAASASAAACARRCEGDASATRRCHSSIHTKPLAPYIWNTAGQPYALMMAGAVTSATIVPSCAPAGARARACMCDWAAAASSC
jgi:hypothetical protein